MLNDEGRLVGQPDGPERDVEQWADFTIKNHDFQREGVVTHMRDEYSTFGWVIERMLTDVGFTLVSADYHAPLHGTYLGSADAFVGMEVSINVVAADAEAET